MYVKNVVTLVTKHIDVHNIGTLKLIRYVGGKGGKILESHIVCKESTPMREERSLPLRRVPQVERSSSSIDVTHVGLELQLDLYQL